MDSFDDHNVYIGQHFAWGGEQKFLGLGQEDRRQHMFVIGQTGAGKSTLLRNLIIQDIHAGRGVGIIDPHGDLAVELLDQIPARRATDVICFDPAALDYPVSFNLFTQCHPDDRHRVASGIVGVFRSIWRESWGPRLEHILYASVAALLECQNTSLLGIPRLLVDERYRQWVLRQVSDPIVRSFWLDEFAQYDPRFLREAISPIQNKVGQLLMAPPIRNILGQVRSRLDFRYIIDHRRIFIANLSKGRLGADKANLLGTLLLTQFQQAAMSRANTPEDKRQDFNLVVDEFHNFTTDGFASMLSESRKYRLSLVLAGQYLDQMQQGIAEAVFGNAGTFIAFRVSEKDAQNLSRHIGGHYDPALYSSLENHQVVAKVLCNGRYGDPLLATTLPPLSMHYGRSENLVRLSRERYAVPRKIVENKIRRWMRRHGDASASGSGQTRRNRST